MENLDDGCSSVSDLGAATLQTCGPQLLGVIETQSGTYYAIGGIETED